MTAPLIVLAAGGTGGHVFPAEALASELAGRGVELALITDPRGTAYGGTLGRLATYPVAASGIAGKGLLGRLKGAVRLGRGSVQAHRLLGELKPAAVVGFGGYASLPALFAATRRRLPTIIHEQNAVLGRANRLLAGRVGVVALSFKETRRLPEGVRAVPTGMPVRPGIAAIRDAAYPEPTADGPLHLLVLGGSQGARVLSRVIPAALAALPEALKARLRVTQQCRPEDLEATRAAYADSGIAADLSDFFNDVPERLTAAHLVIARAGASTVAEVSAAGRPAILVPYPHAIDDHQTFNAHVLDHTGGGWLMPEDTFTPETLGQRLGDLLGSPPTLVRAAEAARRADIPDAAARLADLVLAEAGLAEAPLTRQGRDAA
ncbi:undecaprenyldiphospho-muramoylpentapeptide beta-N-acetylglucosaminyltransferase [Roseospirillum parvum]|uniref:UDP-N-acetylglucosamine--N-acetylmuramyl-(pentapeptide) pyrophosphoryl-undecaprenol N-acetylglucosamine transferase n=1 Tax=Roseospirillum parvum TaxID=83401 RepID=A0A1G7UBP2_9PROT|nr:undecaprenyldiphospho-muramoylpentapeptide beta-N-acetylglucosaminyltransferase [Roseospirillum parvum]SDG44788.1 UDP-N-acetylglucosamine--N-acetylmuramyl-(pentapeptide) pyrophosphoryl-undecaprenol N-acetylglucosamine transferase [Roseospirillum parvum]